MRSSVAWSRRTSPSALSCSDRARGEASSDADFDLLVVKNTNRRPLVVARPSRPGQPLHRRRPRHRKGAVHAELDERVDSRSRRRAGYGQTAHRARHVPRRLPAHPTGRRERAECLLPHGDPTSDEASTAVSGADRLVAFLLAYAGRSRVKLEFLLPAVPGQLTLSHWGSGSSRVMQCPRSKIAIRRNGRVRSLLSKTRTCGSW